MVFVNLNKYNVTENFKLLFIILKLIDKIKSIE